MKHSLSGITILDLSQDIAGPYCTKLMAGFGAEVIKAEPPRTGDCLRRTGPFFQGREEAETGIPFLWLNTGKKGITLDLDAERGVELAKRLAQHVDAVVESFQPGFMEQRGLGYEDLAKINPRIVMTSITPFGTTGPYRKYQAEEIQVQALSGIMHMTGAPDKAPLATGPALCRYTAGQHAYVATLMALFQRCRTGKGQAVEVSMHESALEHLEITLSYRLQTGRIGRRGGHMFVPWNTYECRDGYGTVIAMPYRHWRRAADLFPDDRLFDEKYDSLGGRIQHRAEYEDILKPCVKAHDKRKLFRAGQERGLAFGYVADLPEAVESPQHRARSFFEDVDHPATGSSRYCGAPFRMSETPWVSGRAPLLGEHNREVYGSLLGLSREAVDGLKSEGVI